MAKDAIWPLAAGAVVAASCLHVIALPLLVGFTAIYAKNTGMGVRRSLEARTTEDGAR